MTHCSLHPGIALAASLVLASGCGGSKTPPRPPDVFVVVVDALRGDRLSAYGYSRETSPVLEELAAEGVLFEDVTAQCPWTLPSMVSMLQGRYLTDYRDALIPGPPALAETFSQAGYRTIALVSNCAVDQGQGFHRGFDHFDVIRCWEDEENQERQILRDFQEMREDLRAPLLEALGEGEAEERQPLFVLLMAYDPHSPYLHHPDLDGELPLLETAPVEPGGWQEQMLANHGPAPPAGRDHWEPELRQLTEHRGCYDQEVRHFDRALGGLVADLEELGLEENAIFAVVADHGEGLWENLAPETPEKLATLPPAKFFYQLHGANGYQQVIATPFLLWGAGIPRGLRVKEAVENVDLFPTLLELCDLAPPDGLDGRSLVPLLYGETDEWREFAFSYGVHASSIRELSTGLKLIVPGGMAQMNGREPELYDLRSDPLERNDLAAERPEALRRLSARYREWLAAHPTESNLKGQMGEKAAKLRAELMKKLQGLGYTGMETGAGSGDDE